MKIKILSEDKFWRLKAKYRKSGDYLILELKGLQKCNKNNGRVIYLDKERRKELKKFLREIKDG